MLVATLWVLGELGIMKIAAYRIISVNWDWENRDLEKFSIVFGFRNVGKGCVPRPGVSPIFYNEGDTGYVSLFILFIPLQAPHSLFFWPKWILVLVSTLNFFIDRNIVVLEEMW